jgi:Flp pilus assembly protein TadG
MKAYYRHKGQALVEFALVFPLILLIVVVFIDLGRIVYFHSALTNAVREGARYGIVHQYTTNTQRQSDIAQRVVNYAIGMPVNTTDVTVYCDQSTTNTSIPCSNVITVHAQISIDPMVPFMAQIIGSGNRFNITAESSMQVTPFGNYTD